MHMTLWSEQQYHRHHDLNMYSTEHLDILLDAALVEHHAWLKKLHNHILHNIENPNLDVAQLAEEIGISERSLYNRMNNASGYSPARYIKEIRLLTAMMILEKQTYRTVSEVCYAVGYQKPTYFSAQFKNRLGNCLQTI